MAISLYLTRGKKITCPGARDKLNFRQDKHIFSSNVRRTSKKLILLVYFSLTRTSYLVTGQVKFLMCLPGGQVKIFRFFYPCLLKMLMGIYNGKKLKFKFGVGVAIRHNLDTPDRTLPSFLKCFFINNISYVYLSLIKLSKREGVIMLIFSHCLHLFAQKIKLSTKITIKRSA